MTIQPDIQKLLIPARAECMLAAEWQAMAKAEGHGPRTPASGAGGKGGGKRSGKIPMTERIVRILKRYGPRSKRELSVTLQTTPEHINISLHRLSKAGKARYNGELWEAIR